MGCVLIKRSDQSMYGVLLTNIRDQYGCENNDPPPPQKKILAVSTIYLKTLLGVEIWYHAKRLGFRKNISSMNKITAIRK